jgi:hypothetical protein
LTQFSEHSPLGHEILPCAYTALHTSGYRIYLTEQNNRFGLFAPDLGIRIEPTYEKIGRTGEENDWIRVQQNGKWGWVDKTGKTIIMAHPAYDQTIKASHLFNLLDARGVISVTERQAYIGRVRALAKKCADAFRLTDAGKDAEVAL